MKQKRGIRYLLALLLLLSVAAVTASCGSGGGGGGGGGGGDGGGGGGGDGGDGGDGGGGTVTDNRTGLTWQQGEPGMMSWGSALSYCEGLSLGGKTDWRLPNIKELESLTDTTFFPDAYASYYWSSTTYASYPKYAWVVYGSVDYFVKDGYGLFVRCVRG